MGAIINGKRMAIKVIKVTGQGEASGDILEVGTDAEMAAALTEENLGDYVKYTGSDSDIYEKNRVYVIEEA